MLEIHKCMPVFEGYTVYAGSGANMVFSMHEKQRGLMRKHFSESCFTAGTQHNLELFELD
jgi:hypothetical protein